MSDCFDHCADAWDNRDLHQESGWYGLGCEGTGSAPDPLFYHHKVSFARIYICRK